MTEGAPPAACTCPHCHYHRGANGAPIGNLRDRVVVANRLMDWVHLNPHLPGRGRFSDRDGHLEVSGYHVFLEGKPNRDRAGLTIWNDPSRAAFDSLIACLGERGLGVVFYSSDDEYGLPTLIRRTEVVEAMGSQFLHGGGWEPGGAVIEAYLRRHVPHRYRGALMVAAAAGR